MEAAGEDNPLRRRSLRPDLSIFWHCYTQCDRLRSSGFNGAERIQPVEVENWCRVNGYGDPTLVTECWEVVRRLDCERDELMEELREQEKENAELAAKLKERNAHP